MQTDFNSAVVPNHHVKAIIIASVMEGATPEHSSTSDSRTELDSHANMFVGGNGTTIIATSGKFANVRGFSPDYPALDIPIVDLSFLYEDIVTGRKYIMIAHNALHVPSMTHNLVPPFMMREAGIEVNECAKIHAKDPTVLSCRSRIRCRKNYKIIFRCGDRFWKPPLLLPRSHPIRRL